MVCRGPYSTQEPVECLGVPRAARDPYGAFRGGPYNILGVFTTPRGPNSTQGFSRAPKVLCDAWWALQHPGGPYSSRGSPGCLAGGP